MSYANGTTHYNLPQTVGTDKRDWADPNQAFADIDAAIYGAVQDTAQAALDIDALEGRMDTAEQGISTNTGNIAGLDTRLTTAEGAITSQGAQITDTRQDLEDMICAYNEASATSTHAYSIRDYFIYNDVLYRATASIGIGDTIVPDTNCATTNVTTELLSLLVSDSSMICELVETSTTSAHAYSVDDYFIYNDVLYKVTAPIAIGDSIVVNTNCVATNVAAEITNNKDLWKQSTTWIDATETTSGEVRTKAIPAGKKVVNARLRNNSNGFSWSFANNTLSYTIYGLYQTSWIAITSQQTLDISYVLVDE